MNRRIPRFLQLATALGFTAFFVQACVYEKMEDVECPTGGTTLTYENFGQDFFAKYCNYCHGASVEDRQSAPPAYVFDTEAQIEKWADRIYIRAASRNDTMPPGPDDPPREERDKLAEWLVCTYGD